MLVTPGAATAARRRIRLTPSASRRSVATGATALPAVSRRRRALLDEALGLWRGEPLADLAYEPFAQGEIARFRRRGWRRSRTESTRTSARGRTARWSASSRRSSTPTPTANGCGPADARAIPMRAPGRCARGLPEAAARSTTSSGWSQARSCAQLEQRDPHHDRRSSAATGRPRPPTRAADGRRTPPGAIAAGGACSSPRRSRRAVAGLTRGATIRCGPRRTRWRRSTSQRPRRRRGPVGARPGAVAFGVGVAVGREPRRPDVSRLDPANAAHVRTISLQDVRRARGSAGAVWVASPGSPDWTPSVSVDRIDPNSTRSDQSDGSTTSVRAGRARRGRGAGDVGLGRALAGCSRASNAKTGRRRGS